jgi:hypothetical protein
VTQGSDAISIIPHVLRLEPDIPQSEFQIHAEETSPWITLFAKGMKNPIWFIQWKPPLLGLRIGGGGNLSILSRGKQIMMSQHMTSILSTLIEPYKNMVMNFMSY